MDEPNLPTPALIAAIPPLPYIYDEEDSRCVAILNQVAEFCGAEFTEVPPNPEGTGEEPNPDLDDLRKKYQEALTQNLKEKSSYWSILWQVIRLLSVYSCWNEEIFDTFILQVRVQSVNMEQLPYCTKCTYSCQFNKPITIELDYAPVDPRPQNENDEQGEQMKPFIDGEIQWVDRSGSLHSEPITQEYLNSHYVSAREQIIISPDDFEAFYSGKCECPADITILFRYNAGYLTIPSALLPIICQLISRINDTKLPLSDCASAMTQVCGLLKSKKIGNVQYTWSEADNEMSKTQALITELYNVGNIAELAAISRCDIINVESAGYVI